jgi:hypothetical protein
MRIPVCHAVAAGLLLAPLAGRPQDAAGGAGEPYVLGIEVGESVNLCGTGTVVCPTGPVTCDDPSVAAGEATEKGIALKGLKPGTTLCSTRSAGGQGMLRVYRVVVGRNAGRSP